MKTKYNSVMNIDINKVKPGHLMAFVYYVNVKDMRIQGGDMHLLVQDKDSGLEFEVHGASLVKRSFSADQYLKEEKVTRTELAETLIKSHNVPLTVVFDKADGSERTLRGRLLRAEPILGRSYVEDLDIMDENRTRLVDHRTLKSLIVNGVKYSLKK